MTLVKQTTNWSKCFSFCHAKYYAPLIIKAFSFLFQKMMILNKNKKNCLSKHKFQKPPSFWQCLIQAIYSFGILEHVSNFLAPLTVWWLGLHVFAGVLLIFGIIRKEFIPLMLVALFGADLTGVLTPVQFIVLSIIGMLYIPCLSTITILAKEFGWKAASYITDKLRHCYNCWWNSI